MSKPLADDTPVIVALPAEIDLSNADQVYDQLYAALVSGAPVVIADFTGTRFCDCAFLNRCSGPATRRRVTTPSSGW